MKKFPKNQLIEVFSKDLELPLVNSAGYHAFDKAIASGTRTTDCFHLTYLIEGEAVWQVEDKVNVSVSAGQWAIISPNRSHHGMWNIDKPNKHLWFYFHPHHPKAKDNSGFSNEFLQTAIATFFKSGSAVFSSNDRLEALIRLFIDDMIQSQNNELRIQRLRFDCCQIFLELYEQQAAHSKSLIKTSCLAIDEKIDKWENNEHICQELGQPQRAFSEGFKKEYGLTPWNYVINKRIEKATELLLDTHLPVTTIAHEIGFSSSQYLATSFKKQMGYTPGGFRELFAKG